MKGQAWGNAAASYRPYFDKLCEETGAAAAILFMVGTKEGDATALCGTEAASLRRLLHHLPINLGIAMEGLFMGLLADLARRYPPEHPVGDVPGEVAMVAEELLRRVGDIQKAVEQSARANDPARHKLASMAGGYSVCADCGKTLSRDRVAIVKKLGRSAAGLLIAEYCNILCLASHQIKLATEAMDEMTRGKDTPGVGLAKVTPAFSRFIQGLRK